MKRLVHLIMVSAFCFCWAEVKVEKVFESSSVKEYNQWVIKNKRQHSTLRSIFVRFSKDWQEKTQRYVIEYFSESGEKIYEESMEGAQIYVWTPRENDRVIITQWANSESGKKNEVTIKNKEGTILFTIETLLGYIGMDLYMEGLNAELSSGPDAKVQLFDKNGNVVNTVKGLEGFDEAFYPNDERFSVFKALHGYAGATFIMVNNKGQEVWRKEFKEYVNTSIFISKDGTKIGINYGGNILLYDEHGDLFRKYKAFGIDEMRLKSALSDNGNWLVTGLLGQVKLYNNLTGELVWQNSKALTSNNDEVRYIHVTSDGDKILVLCNSHYLYIFNIVGELLKSIDLDLGFMKQSKTKRTTDKMGRPIIEIVGEEKVRTGYWKSETVDNYLIITKTIDPYEKKEGSKWNTYIIYEIKGD